MDFIIPICNMNNDGFHKRLFNLQTIISIIPSEVNIILIEQIIDKNLPTYTKNINKKNIDIILVNYPIFCKPWLINIGAKNSKSNNLLISEMDMKWKPNYFDRLLTYTEKYKWFFAWNKIIFYGRDEIKIDREVEKPIPGKAEGGIVYFHKEFYWEIGGNNEWMLDLGGMDNEIIRRAEYKSKNYMAFPETIYHMWHPRHQLKINSWKNNTRREENLKVYYAVKNNPKKYITLLSSFLDNIGNKSYPVSKIHNLI